MGVDKQAEYLYISCLWGRNVADVVTGILRSGFECNMRETQSPAEQDEDLKLSTELLPPRISLLTIPQEGKSVCGFKVGNQGRRKCVVKNLQRNSWGSVQFRFICDLEKGVSSELPKFADGIKLFVLVRSRTSCEDV